jgi:ankyrin repeat protein
MINIHSPDVLIEDLDQELAENPDRLEEVSFNGWTPLIAACNYGNIEITKWLLENGADIHARDNVRRCADPSNHYYLYFNLFTLLQYGGTCLHWACREGKEEMARFLLDYGADMESVNNVRLRFRSERSFI